MVKKKGLTSFMWSPVGSITTAVTPDMLAEVWNNQREGGTEHRDHRKF